MFCLNTTKAYGFSVTLLTLLLRRAIGLSENLTQTKQRRLLREPEQKNERMPADLSVTGLTHTDRGYRKYVDAWQHESTWTIPVIDARKSLMILRQTGKLLSEICLVVMPFMW